MKILFISQYFDPETFRGNDIAYYLATKGNDVTVITGTPNYPKGKFFEGYGLFKKNVEHKNGVKIIRIPIFPRGNSSVTLILNYFSYAINASLYMLWHALKNSYDICFVQQLSPVMMSWPGIIHKKVTKKPLITWILDLWPESLKAAGGINNKQVLGLFEKFTVWEYKNSDLLLTSSKNFEKSIVEKGDFSDKIKFFPQWADVHPSDEEKDIPPLPEGFKVMFTGNVGESQDFDHIVEAAKLLSDNDKICFVIVGDGRKSDWVKEQIKIHNLQNRICMMGRYPADYMHSFLSKADVLMASLKNEPIFNLTMPAKIQSYMAIGKPIVTMMNGAGADVIKEAKCGIAVPAESPSKLVDALRSLKSLPNSERERMGKNGKEYYLINFEKEKCLSRLELILKEVSTK